MKPQRFEVGQAVTPKQGVNWKALPGYEHLARPKQGDIYHVKMYTGERCRCGCGVAYLQIIELENVDYIEDKFEPVISDSVLEEALKEISEPIEA